mmetsp:Transcript_1586/g.2403  ORF Transcript_1586/g.2403 Transcript_1586/m.2403 type:complete len:87 (-) Transcript_1586:307-567(-)
MTPKTEGTDFKQGASLSPFGHHSMQLGLVSHLAISSRRSSDPVHEPKTCLDMKRRHHPCKDLAKKSTTFISRLIASIMTGAGCGGP